MATYVSRSQRILQLSLRQNCEIKEQQSRKKVDDWLAKCVPPTKRVRRSNVEKENIVPASQWTVLGEYRRTFYIAPTVLACNWPV
jgi:hypothetical protein